MTAQEMQTLKEALVITAEICGRQLSDLAIKAIAEDLGRLPFEETLSALSKLRRKGKFPTVAEIEAIAAPTLDPIDDAREVSSLIVYAVSRHGWCNPEKAREHIGDVGWEIVKRLGGWASLCETMNTRNQSYLTTQITQMAESLIKRHALGLADKRPAFAIKHDAQPAQVFPLFLTKSIPTGDEREPERT